MTQLIQSAREFYSSPLVKRTVRNDGVLVDLKDELLGCFASGIQTANFKRPALEGYMQLVQMRDYLSTEEIGFVVQTLNGLVLTVEAHDLT